MSWMRLTQCENIPLREGRSARIAGRDIAVFNLGTRFAAVENRCPHGGGPLADGIVAGNAVVCPMHAWKVCLESGGVERPMSSACVRTYPVEVRDGVVLIQMPTLDEVAA